MDRRHLIFLLEDAARRFPDRPAVEDELGRSIDYQTLLFTADRVATRLARWGVDRGDRVGIWLPKSLESVIAIHGVMRSGGAYVPVDPTGPVARSVGILHAAGVKAVVVDHERGRLVREAWPGGPLPRMIQVDSVTEAVSPELEADTDTDLALWSRVAADDAPCPLPPPRSGQDLAYILFTSGSTGAPKGVMLTHENALSFLDWCDRDLGPFHPHDRFSSHAPLHFDLSILDLFASCRAAATVVLIGEGLARDPAALGRFIRDRAISVWYSAPSILALLVERGGFMSDPSPAPRLVLFAGEVFPIGPLKALRAIWPRAVMWNLYGPTETNVCTAFRVPDTIPADRDQPFPIGPVCPPLVARLVDAAGIDTPPGAIGELVIAGPGVMRGYFGRPDLDHEAFLVDNAGTRWYRTGDLARDSGGGVLEFHGRRDRMVKKRGYRIELGEIESALYQHDGVDRAGVVARSDDLGVSIAAFVALKPEVKRSVIALKRHCVSRLPSYMIPDTIVFLDRLPATSTDKVDYQRLTSLVAGEGARC